MDFTLRLYEPRFNAAIQELFYASVHNISTRFYSPQQLDVWAPENTDPLLWSQRLQDHYTLLAIDRSSDNVVGFGSALCPHQNLNTAEQSYLRQCSQCSLCSQSMAQPHSVIGLLDHLFVAPAAQGNHIASALCHALEKHMQEQHCDLIFVHASHAAQPVFAHFGYQQIVELKNDLQGMIITNNLMAKQILPAKM